MTKYKEMVNNLFVAYMSYRSNGIWAVASLIDGLQQSDHLFLSYTEQPKISCPRFNKNRMA